MNLPALTTLGGIGITAGLAALAAGWQQVRSMFARIAGLLVISVEFDGGYASAAARAYCRKTLRSTPTAFRRYTGRIRFIRPKTRHGLVVYEEMGVSGRLYWLGWKPIWAGARKGGGGNDSPSMTNSEVVFRFLRGTFDPDALALEVAALSVENEAESKDEPRGAGFRVVRYAGTSAKAASMLGQKGEVPSPPGVAAYNSETEIGRLVGWQETDLVEGAPGVDPIERLSLTSEVEQVVQDILRWFRSKKWYGDRQIPWRFGTLFFGQPGTGKSSLAKAIAQRLKLPIVQMDISTMDNTEFYSAYQSALNYAPAMVLIEDIDAVFNGRENVAAERGKGLTFDCLLNTISGVENSDGILLVITTNNIDRVDSALGVPQHGTPSSRPGRIDRAVEMPALTQEGRKKLARRIMSGCHDSWVEYLVRLGQSDTGAQFEDRCATKALELYWSKDPQLAAPEAT